MVCYIFVRYWRQWILLSEKYTLKQNILTSNPYLHIKLNAHALLTFLMSVCDNVSKTDIVFFPWLLGLESSEKTFRSAHSISNVFSSVLNFSILGILCWLHHLNIQAVLQADAEKSGIRFPYAEKHLGDLAWNHMSLHQLQILVTKKFAKQLRKR